jgi:CubicO group peptidase (beta-lactamase class C family)
MRKTHITVFIILTLMVFIGCQKTAERDVEAEKFLGKGEYLGEYWPTEGWRTCRPEEVGMNSEKLVKVYEYAANLDINTQGIAVIRKGYIVGEAYFNDFKMDSRHESFSIAKSFSSALIGIAIDKGFIESVEERLAEFYPEWQTPSTSESKKQMTIKDLLTMRSGLQWNEDDYYKDRSQNDVYIMIDSAPDYIQYVLNKPVIHEPGTHWYYSSGDSILLSGIIEKSTGMTAYEFASQYIFRPMGLTEIIWLADPAGHTITAWGIQGTVREFAKFGYLYLKKGRWEDLQVVPKDWIEESSQPVSEEIEKYGYQWWRLPVLKGYEETKIPRDILIAWGIFTQQIFIIPTKDLLVVRLGHDQDPYNDEWLELEFLSLVLNSLED